jgi:hypothetical protein
MVEAESDVLVQKYANEISAAIRSSIGE